jgi:hypothetical protein
MTLSRRLRLAAVLAVCNAAAAMVASAANAGLIFRETFHEDDTELLTNFCDVAGLDVTFRRIVDGRAKAVSHGRDQLPYLQFHITLTEVVTNVDTGDFVTTRAAFIDKDLRVTDTSDGTLTLLVLTTGNAVLYNEDDEVIARNPGQTRVELLIDHGGTPTDPSDDEFLEFLGDVKESTGRTDDFCDAAVPFLT